MLGEKTEVIGLRLMGGAYKNGHYIPGWNEVTLEGGKTFVVGNLSGGMNAILDYADSLGYSTTDYRGRLDNWVKTGKFTK